MAEVSKISAKELDTKVDVAHDEEKVQVSQAIPVSAFNDLTVRQTVTKFWKTFLFCQMALFLACADGFQYSLPGNLIAQTSFINQFGRATDADGKPALHAKDVSAWGGMYSGAYIAALLVGGFPADWFGRRFNMALFSVLMIVACVVEMVARDWVVWGISKILAGLSIGICQMTLTSYVSELAPAKMRGLLLVCYSFWWAFGTFTAAIASYVIQQQPNRTRLYLNAIYSEWIFSGLSIIFILILPESPRWCLTKGKRDQAIKILNRINRNVEGYDAEHELAVMEYDLLGEKRNQAGLASTSYLDLFKGCNLRRTIVSFSVLGWQQCVGIAIVYGYNSIFFKAAGLKNPFLGTICVNLITLTTVACSGYFMDRFGRRPLLITGGCIVVVCLVLIGSLAFLKVTPAIGAVTVFLMCFWVLAYSFSIGPGGYLLLGESSSPALRAKTAGVAAAGSGVFGLIFNYCTPLMILEEGGAGWGMKTSYFYAGTGFIGLVLIFFFLPEHRGRSYAELNELYERRIPARKFKTTKTEVEIEGSTEVV